MVDEYALACLAIALFLPLTPLLRLDRDSFDRVVEQNPVVARGIYRVLTERLRNTLARVAVLAERRTQLGSGEAGLHTVEHVLAAVVGVPHDSHGEEIKAYVILNDGASLTGDDLVAWCKEQMAAYKYPRIVEVTDGLPMTATGKILKRELK